MESEAEAPSEAPQVELTPTVDTTSKRAAQRQALLDDPGPPFGCRYEGCEETRESRQGRGGHERYAHGRVFKGGAIPAISPPEGAPTDEDLEAAYQRGRFDGAMEAMERFSRPGAEDDYGG